MCAGDGVSECESANNRRRVTLEAVSQPHNDLFKALHLLLPLLHLLHLPSHPGSACVFCFLPSLGGQLRRCVCLALPFDWPGMLERAMSTLIVSNRGWHAVSWEDCLFGKEAGQSQQIEPGEPRAARRRETQLSVFESVVTDTYGRV